MLICWYELRQANVSVCADLQADESRHGPVCTRQLTWVQASMCEHWVCGTCRGDGVSVCMCA